MASVIKLYLDDVATGHARPKETGMRAKALLAFFGDKMLSDITGQVCRQYAKNRSSASAARRELEDLRSAIRHHWVEGLATSETKIVMPQKSRPRERWLTRKEAAALLWAAYKRNKHVARFILIALYTGSRTRPILEAQYGGKNGKPFL